jgi:hypothetical protein
MWLISSRIAVAVEFGKFGDSLPEGMLIQILDEGLKVGLKLFFVPHSPGRELFLEINFLQLPHHFPVDVPLGLPYFLHLKLLDYLTEPVFVNFVGFVLPKVPQHHTH